MGKPVVEGSLESPPFEKPSIEQVKSQNMDLVGVWWFFFVVVFLYIYFKILFWWGFEGFVCFGIFCGLFFFLQM